MEIFLSWFAGLACGLIVGGIGGYLALAAYFSRP